jgi:hypothetical protein
MQNYIRGTQKNGATKSNVFTSGSPVANPNPIQCLSRFFFFFTYPVRCFRVPPWIRVPQAENHCSRAISQNSPVWLIVGV